MTIKLHKQTKSILANRGWSFTRAGKYYALLADFEEPVILKRSELETWIFRRDKELAQ